MRDRSLCTGTVQLSDVIVVFFPEFGTAFLHGNAGKVTTAQRKTEDEMAEQYPRLLYGDGRYFV